MNLKNCIKTTVCGFALAALVMSVSDFAPARTCAATAKSADEAIKDAKNVAASAASASSAIDATSVKNISDQVNKKTGTGTTSNGIIPKVYNSHSLEMKKKKETINGYIYFNQGDSAWNDNGYQIKHAGCGPTSMAVVISSLTSEWVTPVDTTKWAYEHGYYSSNGASHSLIKALSEEYGLDCEGVGRDEAKIREALQDGNPVVCLMGPGYFTRGGHFMVLVGIDDDDNVTVADVASRERSSYKYPLSTIIRQSKNASSGGPFWIISGGDADPSENVTTAKREKVKLTYEVMKNISEKAIRNTIKKGNPVMMLTDSKLIDGHDFVYVTGITSNGLATVTDTDYETTKQYRFTTIMKHRKKDATGISCWKVKGRNVDFLMPLTGKDS